MIAAGEVRVKHLVQTGTTTTGSGISIKVYQSQDLVIADKAGLKAYACKSGAAACEGAIDALPDNENGWAVGAEVARFCGRDIYQRTAVAYDSSQCVADVLGNPASLSVGSTRNIPSRTSARTSNLFADTSSYVKVGTFADMNIQAAAAATATTPAVAPTTLAAVVAATRSAAPVPTPAPTPGPTPPSGPGTSDAAAKKPSGSLEFSLIPSSPVFGFSVSGGLKVPFDKKMVKVGDKEDEIEYEWGMQLKFSAAQDLGIPEDPSNIHGTFEEGKPHVHNQIQIFGYGEKALDNSRRFYLTGDALILKYNPVNPFPGIGVRPGIKYTAIPKKLELTSSLFIGASKAIFINAEKESEFGGGPAGAISGGVKYTPSDSKTGTIRKGTALSLNLTYSDGESAPQLFTLIPSAALAIGVGRLTFTPALNFTIGADLEGGASKYILEPGIEVAYKLQSGAVFTKFQYQYLMVRDDRASSENALIDSATGDAGVADFSGSFGRDEHGITWDILGYRHEASGAYVSAGITQTNNSDYTDISGGGVDTEGGGGATRPRLVAGWEF